MFNNLKGMLKFNGSLRKRVEKARELPQSKQEPAPKDQPSHDSQVDAISLINEMKEAVFARLGTFENRLNEKDAAGTGAGNEDTEAKLSKLESAMSTIKNSVGEVNEKLGRHDEQITELLSLQEVVTTEINPFVEGKNPVTHEKVEQIEKDLAELKQNIPSGLKEEFDARVKAIEDKLELLVQANPGAVDEEALIAKVSERVVEQLKPFLEQKPSQLDKPQQVNPKPSVPFSNIKEAPVVKEHPEESGIKLTHIDGSSETVITLYNLIYFITDRVGQNSLFDVLRHYVDLGWITEEVGSVIMTYAKGLDCVECPEGTACALSAEDHMKVREYIERLSGKTPNKTVFLRNCIERNNGGVRTRHINHDRNRPEERKVKSEVEPKKSMTPVPLEQKLHNTRRHCMETVGDTDETQVIDPVVNDNGNGNVDSAVKLLSDVGMSGITNAASALGQLSGQEDESLKDKVRVVQADGIREEVAILGESVVSIEIGLHGKSADGEVRGAMLFYLGKKDALDFSNELLCNTPATAITGFTDDIISPLKETSNIFGGNYVTAISEYTGIRPISLNVPVFRIVDGLQIEESLPSEFISNVEFALASDVDFGKGRKGLLIILLDSATLGIIIKKLFGGGAG